MRLLSDKSNPRNTHNVYACMVFLVPIDTCTIPTCRGPPAPILIHLRRRPFGRGLLSVVLGRLTCSQRVTFKPETTSQEICFAPYVFAMFIILSGLYFIYSKRARKETAVCVTALLLTGIDSRQKKCHCIGSFVALFWRSMQGFDSVREGKSPCNAYGPKVYGISLRFGYTFRGFWYRSKNKGLAFTHWFRWIVLRLYVVFCVYHDFFPLICTKFCNPSQTWTTSNTINTYQHKCRSKHRGAPVEIHQLRSPVQSIPGFCQSILLRWCPLLPQ